MEENKHTAWYGWEVSVAHDIRGYPAFYINGLSGDQKRDANDLESARCLIAAAPEMLEALEEASREYDGFEDGNGDPCPTLKRIRAALAKAKGASA